MMKNLFKICLVAGVGFLASCGDEKGDYVKPVSKIDAETPSNALPENSNAEVSDIRWKLEFSDEFNDSRVDFNKWTINNDTKTRTPRPALGIKEWFHKPENVREVQNEDGGMLVLEAKKIGTDVMYCSSVNTRDKYFMNYGYAEVRVKVADTNRAVHTAFWFQSPDVNLVDGTGNDGAEIDVFESAFVEDKTASTIHIDGYGNDHQENSKRYPAAGLHVVSMSGECCGMRIRSKSIMTES